MAEPWQLEPATDNPSAALRDWWLARGFQDPAAAQKRACNLLKRDPRAAACLQRFLQALAETPHPDGSLLNFERLLDSSTSALQTFDLLTEHPRSLDILVKLFVSSQYLTEILLQQPETLAQLVQHRQLADFKSREDFTAEALASARAESTPDRQRNALRRYQRWEILRIGACDTFGLLDLKATTNQLSLLGDGLIRSCLILNAGLEGMSPDDLTVLALGKLGGEELNYSSDIDLVFISERPQNEVLPLAQKLVRWLQDSTAEGFLYRVDMRLRPWGRAGQLVTTPTAYFDYLRQHAEPWERQALLKARAVAGDERLGRRFLKQLPDYIFCGGEAAVRTSVREAKERIEAQLKKKGKDWGEVKSGAGSIRDVEFVTQFLQLAHGGRISGVRSSNTLDALIRLADLDLLQADEYRYLTSGYVFLRTVEHALQLMHNTQEHSLPRDRRELEFLARRLDFGDADSFVMHYERHVEAIRRIYEKYLAESPPVPDATSPTSPRQSLIVTNYQEVFTEAERREHRRTLEAVSADHPVRVLARPIDDELWRVTVLGLDEPGDLSMICGLLFVYGCDILEGCVSTGNHPEVWQHLSRIQKQITATAGQRADVAAETARDFVNLFTVRPPAGQVLKEAWLSYEADLLELMLHARRISTGAAQGRLARRVAAALQDSPGRFNRPAPVDVTFDNTIAEDATVIDIRADDTIGFLYELSNSLAMSGVNISQVAIRSDGNVVHDSLAVTDARTGGKIVDPGRLQELRAAVVLIKQFTHVLPRSPNPEAALLHFRSFLRDLFERPDWTDELSSLERPDVLDALAQLMGVSDFLWDEFLRVQYSNLFPVLRDLPSLQKGTSRAELDAKLKESLGAATTADDRRDALNVFKDREMFRVDMRHILGHIPDFTQFSAELSDVAEVVVSAAYDLVEADLRRRYGIPQLGPRRPCRGAVLALGKCGGRELGFASDIELLFVYENEGHTAGPEVISCSSYFQRLVESFNQTIRARHEGIFRIDLRLRPYGRAGSLAVSMEAFRQYFAEDGPAWPYERQALVKLRPLAGDESLARELSLLRDRLLYTGKAFDPAPMRAMRERQIRQLVQGGTFNAKLSAGGLVDVEYLVQALQISGGHRLPALRTTSTREALDALRQAGSLRPTEHEQLVAAYRFLRRLIDSLRMVRGDARDLTVPPVASEDFEFLSRRLGYGGRPDALEADLELHSQRVQELSRRLLAAP